MVDLVRVRRGLFERLSDAGTPERWQSIQLRIAAAVLRAEERRRSATKGERSQLRRHIELCRAYADAIAWRTMSAHAIRQHATLPGRPPHLGGIRHLLPGYFRIARTFISHGLPALLPDLTNILRLGDVVVVGDPSAPEVVEVKGDDLFITSRLDAFVRRQAGLDSTTQDEASSVPARGRVGRQLSQLRARQEYLIEDRGRFPGEDLERHAVTIEPEPVHLYSEVAAAVSDALRVGYGVAEQPSGHCIVAVELNYGGTEPQEALRSFGNDARYPLFASNLRPWDRFWWIAPPPTEWGTPDEIAWALMEGQVLVFHAVDLGAMEDGSTDKARFSVRMGAEGPQVWATAGGHTMLVTEKPVLDVVRGFEAMDSFLTRAQEFVPLMAQLLSDQ